jgi:hypothetical protein
VLAGGAWSAARCLSSGGSGVIWSTARGPGSHRPRFAQCPPLAAAIPINALQTVMISAASAQANLN